MSTGMARDALPSRSTTRSCSTRRSFAWFARLRSPASSRKSVPPFADSIKPFFMATAPVKPPGTLARFFGNSRPDVTLVFHPIESDEDLPETCSLARHLLDFSLDRSTVCILPEYFDRRHHLRFKWTCQLFLFLEQI